MPHAPARRPDPARSRTPAIPRSRSAVRASEPTFSSTAARYSGRPAGSAAASPNSAAMAAGGASSTRALPAPITHFPSASATLSGPNSAAEQRRRPARLPGRDDDAGDRLRAVRVPLPFRPPDQLRGQMLAEIDPPHRDLPGIEPRRAKPRVALARRRDRPGARNYCTGRIGSPAPAA